jgi:hypothetical protein
VPTAVSRMGFSEPHDPPFSSHFSCTAITDTPSQSRNDSPTVQYRKLCPSPETDPTSAAKPSSALFEKLTQSRQLAAKSDDPAPPQVHAKSQKPQLSPYSCS